MKTVQLQFLQVFIQLSMMVSPKTGHTFHALPFHVAQQLFVIQNLESVVCGGPLFDCLFELF